MLKAVMSKPSDQPSDDRSETESGTLSDLLKQKRRSSAATSDSIPNDQAQSNEPDAVPQQDTGTLGDLLKEKRRVQSGSIAQTSNEDQTLLRPAPPSHLSQPHSTPVGCWLVPLVFLSLIAALVVWTSWPLVLSVRTSWSMLLRTDCK